MGLHTVEITDSNFQVEVIESTIPVLVDFWAPWCGPCKQIAPIIEQIAEAYTGRVKVGKVNVDDNIEIANNYKIRGIPTILIFKNGQVADQQVGASPKETLTKMIDRLFS